MFGPIFTFELKQWFKRPAVYIFFAIFFISAVFVMMAQGGVFGNPNTDSNTIVNSAKAIAAFVA